MCLAGFNTALHCCFALFTFFQGWSKQTTTKESGKCAPSVVLLISLVYLHPKSNQKNRKYAQCKAEEENYRFMLHPAFPFSLSRPHGPTARLFPPSPLPLIHTPRPRSQRPFSPPPTTLSEFRGAQPLVLRSLIVHLTMHPKPDERPNNKFHTTNEIHKCTDISLRCGRDRRTRAQHTSAPVAFFSRVPYPHRRAVPRQACFPLRTPRQIPFATL